jgi:hypothetical protein
LIGLQGAQQLDPIVKQKKHRCGKIARQAVPAARRMAANIAKLPELLLK